MKRCLLMKNSNHGLAPMISVCMSHQRMGYSLITVSYSEVQLMIDRRCGNLNMIEIHGEIEADT